MNASEAFEVKVSKKRLISIPKDVAERLGIEEGTKLRLYVEGDRIVIEPVRDALWFALHGPKVGRVTFEELEEESEREQEKLSSAP
jgi:AbrB family looped-hinge helix DNA binding protein